MKQEKSVGAIIYYNDTKREYLLLHYEEGHWGLPKGHTEAGETEKETLLREIKEETGLDQDELELQKGFKEKISYYFTYQGEKRHKLVIYYLVRSKLKNIILSFEHTNHAWLPFNKAVERLSFENTRKILLKADEFLESLKRG